MKGCFASEEHIVVLTYHNAINPLCYTGEKKHLKYNISQPARAKQVFSQVKKPLYTLYMVTLRL